VFYGRGHVEIQKTKQLNLEPRWLQRHLHHLAAVDVVHHEPPKERLAYLDRLEADASRVKASPEWKEKERQREEDQRPRPHKGDTVNRASRGFWDSGSGGGGDLPSYRPSRKGPSRG
ncbi:hypothetical protein FOL47_008761, partial [Perkinsus chesapeaki]